MTSHLPPQSDSHSPSTDDAMVASKDEAFDRYLGHGKPAFVAKTGFSYQDAMQMIAAAGGVPRAQKSRHHHIMRGFFT